MYSSAWIEHKVHVTGSVRMYSHCESLARSLSALNNVSDKVFLEIEAAASVCNVDSSYAVVLVAHNALVFTMLASSTDANRPSSALRITNRPGRNPLSFGINTVLSAGYLYPGHSLLFRIIRSTISQQYRPSTRTCITLDSPPHPPPAKKATPRYQDSTH